MISIVKFLFYFNKIEKNINNLNDVIISVLKQMFPDCEKTNEEVVYKVPTNIYPKPIQHIYSDCNSDTLYECGIIDIHFNGKEYWYTLRQTLADTEDMEDDDCEYDSRNVSCSGSLGFTFDDLMTVYNCLSNSFLEII